MKNIKGTGFLNSVIFDMDGVIVDGMPYHIESWKKALSTVGISVTDLEIYLMEGMTGEETIKELTNKKKKCDGSKSDCDCDLHPQKRMRQYD